MPSTYPRMTDRSYPHPSHSPHQQPPSPSSNTHTPPTPGTPSSRFLSPIQEARILSWRGHTTPMPESPKEKVSKSAPATLDHDPACTASGRSSSHHSREKASSADRSSRCSCSCSSHHPPQSGRPNLPPRHTVGNVPSSQSQGQGQGKGHRHQHQMRSYYSSKKKSSTSASSATPPVLSPPISRGPPSNAQYFPQEPPGQQHGYDAPPMQYTQTAPQIPPPISQPPPPRPDPPRIAGASDPISQA